MRILITGGSGFIGSHLIPHLLAHGHHVQVLTRHPLRAYQKLGHQITTHQQLNDFSDFNGFDAIINLAGEPIANGRWSNKKKQRICQSRWEITEHLCDLIMASEYPPEVFLSGSAIGYYGDHGSQFIYEDTDSKADDFAYKVCSQWENIALRVSERTRVCLLRTGLVLGNNGGLIKQLIKPFKLGLGGPIGSGQHYQSWIHMHDMVHALEYLLTHKTCQGPFNLTAPMPVTNAILSQSLAKHLHRPAFCKVPEVVIKLALGELSEMVLASQRVLPQRLQQAGFTFMFKEIDGALSELFPPH
ncbi:TIGR01777 family oxidoreductase [Celerinatantimonas diazotrophica]|uniref:TIGR01777 family protein n=1 Tax=Celerinatantimonas diazotrophica TaxID=412034 RepID=A0A4R1JLU1_9GAMM|nr:TIGR01777 family oxidoreductase [Celerinatantimonas diazotrophica]TCK51910.1 hypothetical protein EV690_1997 [Celerinatantimonas diazotrophica]CAG9296394.1 Epimerase family protein [Celerinatantimonas diazotrophica]